jgi:hypothetical protein
MYGWLIWEKAICTAVLFFGTSFVFYFRLFLASKRQTLKDKPQKAKPPKKQNPSGGAWGISVHLSDYIDFIWKKAISVVRLDLTQKKKALIRAISINLLSSSWPPLFLGGHLLELSVKRRDNLGKNYYCRRSCNSA